MKLSHRAYPYPVVGNGDDVVDTAFQSPVEVERDGINYYLHVNIQCSSRTIKKLIQKGDAVYVLHVECSNTMYRAVYEFSEDDKVFMIPGENLNAGVEVNIFARARKDIAKYKVENAHEDYGRITFHVSAGNILAIAEGHNFDADINFDALQEISSFMQVKQSDNPGDTPMTVELGGEKIIVYLCKQDFENYKFIKAHPILSSCLTSTIVLPALIEAIRDVKKGDYDAYQDARWCRCLKRRVESIGQTFDSMQPLELAQSILELPIRRAFSSARTLLESEV